jgi:dihydrofolate reductase
VIYDKYINDKKPIANEQQKENMMRKVIVSEYVTLDGVMEDPGGLSRFKDGNWHFPHWSEETNRYKFDELFASDALLLGRVTYQEFAAAWPFRTDEEGFADRMNGLPKYVVSTTLSEVTWHNSRLIKENISEEVSRLKQEVGQDVLVTGSGDLVQTLMRYGLVDEYRLMVHPVVVGSGRCLFQDWSKTTLRLVATKAFPSGVVLLSYQPKKP